VVLLIITIAGNAGSGKSTVAKEVAKKLKYNHYSSGDAMRSIAKQRAITILELNKLGEKDPSIDHEVDGWVDTLGKTENNFVIDSRLAFHFIPHSFKVFLTGDFEVRMDRIFKEGKRVSEEHKTVEDLKEFMQEREASEMKRYKKLYHLNYYEEKNYDLVVDTTEMNVKEVVKEILVKVREHQ
jgi:CMP/dCMP kinase